MVGERTAQFLAEHFGSMDDLMKATEEELQQVNRIGRRVSGSIREFFDEPKNVALVERLREAGLTFKGRKKQRATTLSGKTFVLTGTLERHTRDEAKKLIEDAGGQGSQTVSKKTDYVVAGAEAGSKLDKAREVGVGIISENEMEKLLKGASGVSRQHATRVRLGGLVRVKAACSSSQVCFMRPSLAGFRNFRAFAVMPTRLRRRWSSKARTAQAGSAQKRTPPPDR